MMDILRELEICGAKAEKILDAAKDDQQMTASEIAYRLGYLNAIRDLQIQFYLQIHFPKDKGGQKNETIHEQR